MFTRAAVVAGLLGFAACGDPTVTVTVTELDGGHGVAVAYQDGDGPWQAVASTTDTYRFDVGAGRYGVAVWCAASRSRRVVFDYLTTDELTELGVVGGCPTADITLNGLVRNLADSAEVSWSFSSVTASGAGNYALMGPAGTHDLVGASYQLTATGRAVDSLVILRDQTIEANRRVDLDLAADPIAVETHDVTLDGELADDFTFVSSALSTAGHTTAALGTASGDDHAFQAVPADALVDGDRQVTTVQVTGPAVAGAPQRVRTHVAHAEAGADLAVTLLAPTDAPEVSAGPTFTWSVFDGAQAYQLAVNQIDSGGAEHDYDGAWSPGYLGDDIVLALPDLSGVDGWDPRVELVDTTTLFWALSARTSNGSLGRLLSAPVAGAEVSSTGWYGSVAP